MDLRFVVCDLIVRDAVLRALLLNRADRVESGASRGGTAPGDGFLVLEWTGDDPADSPADVQWLTATVHLPRFSSSDRLYLDVLLRRLRTVLSGPENARTFTTRCLGTSPALLDSQAGTVSKTSTYEIAAVPSPCDAPAGLGSGSWPGRVHPVAVADRPHSSLSSLN